jgi:uncharacterized protein (DUF433 family)
MTLTLNAQIDASPDVRFGKPCVVGTRIAVHDVVLSHFRLGQTVEEVAVAYNLTVAAVYAALAYYAEHRVEIDTEMALEEVEADAAARSASSPLQEKLARIRGA